MSWSTGHLAGKPENNAKFVRTLWKFVRRRGIALIVLLLLAAIYSASWSYRRKIGLIQPMANFRYFYFGSGPNRFSDRVLYWVYYPAYRPYLAWQWMRYGERFDIHWSDRADPYDPSVFD